MESTMKQSSIFTSTILASTSASPTLEQEALKKWQECSDRLMHTTIALSIVNFIIFILTIVGLVALNLLRKRCRELNLFMAVMEGQMQRAVLPPALVQKAVEASNELGKIVCRTERSSPGSDLVVCHIPKRSSSEPGKQMESKELVVTCPLPKQISSKKSVVMLPSPNQPEAKKSMVMAPSPKQRELKTSVMTVPLPKQAAAKKSVQACPLPKKNGSKKSLKKKLRSQRRDEIE